MRLGCEAFDWVGHASTTRRSSRDCRRREETLLLLLTHSVQLFVVHHTCVCHVQRRGCILVACGRIPIARSLFTCRVLRSLTKAHSRHLCPSRPRATDPTESSLSLMLPLSRDTRHKRYTHV